jgi:hypothetical protein
VKTSALAVLAERQPGRERRVAGISRRRSERERVCPRGVGRIASNNTAGADWSVALCARKLGVISLASLIRRVPGFLPASSPVGFLVVAVGPYSEAGPQGLSQPKKVFRDTMGPQLQLTAVNYGEVFSRLETH